MMVSHLTEIPVKDIMSHYRLLLRNNKTEGFTEEDADTLVALGFRIRFNLDMNKVSVPGPIKPVSDFEVPENTTFKNTGLQPNIIRTHSDSKPVDSGEFITCDGWGSNHMPGGVIITHGKTRILQKTTESRTNNYREILAIREGVQVAYDKGVKTVYSDSDTALSWVEKQRPKTVDDLEEIMELIRVTRDLMLAGNITLKKWLTKQWDTEIYADAGRK